MKSLVRAQSRHSFPRQWTNIPIYSNNIKSHKIPITIDLKLTNCIESYRPIFPVYISCIAVGICIMPVNIIQSHLRNFHIFSGFGIIISYDYIIRNIIILAIHS